MHLYMITQDVNNDYDTFKGAVVAAASTEDARMTPPSDYIDMSNPEPNYSWCRAQDVSVTYIGEAADGTEPGVILASFRAG